MNINFCWLLLGCIVSSNLAAQTPVWEWVNVFNGKSGQYCNAIAIDPSGQRDIYVAGSFSETVDFNPGVEEYSITASRQCGFLSKYDTRGNFIWVKTIGPPGQARIHSLIIDPETKDIYAIGWFSGTVDFDPGADSFKITTAGSSGIFINKFDAFGNFIWAKGISGLNGFGSSNGFAFDPRGSGSIYLTGSYNGTMDFDPGPEVYNLTSVHVYDIFIVKLNGDGNFQWAKSIGSSSYDYGTAITTEVSGNGDIYVTGSFNGTVDFDPGLEKFTLGSLGSADVFILKLDRNGIFIWAKRIGGVGDDRASDITIDREVNNNIFITGFFQKNVDFDPGAGKHELNAGDHSSLFVSSFDSGGYLEWAKMIGGMGYCFGENIILSPLGNNHVYVSGLFCGAIDFDTGTGTVELLSAGKLGSTDCGDIFILELDALGNFIWVKVVNGDKFDLANSLAVDDLSNIYVAGQYSSKNIPFDEDIFTNADSIDATSDMFFAKLAF